MAEGASVSGAMLGYSLRDTVPLAMVSSLTPRRIPGDERRAILTRTRLPVNALYTTTAYCLKERTDSGGVSDG
jgi:hypothetical protein